MFQTVYLEFWNIYKMSRKESIQCNLPSTSHKHSKFSLSCWVFSGIDNNICHFFKRWHKYIIIIPVAFRAFSPPRSCKACALRCCSNRTSQRRRNSGSSDPLICDREDTSWLLGLGRYAFVPIQFFKNTWVPIRFELRFSFIAIR